MTMAAVSRCALFRKKDNFPYMVSQEHLEGLFCESAPPILELSELRKWCEEKQLDDRDLQAHLQALVQLDHIGCRKISTGTPGSEETTVYWLKNALQKSAVNTPASTLKQQHSALRGGLKRTRPKFVSPLLAHKKPKLVPHESDREKESAATATSTTTDTNVNKTTPALRARLEFGDAQKDTGSALPESGRSMQQSEKITLTSSEMESSCTGKDTSGDDDIINSVQLLEDEKRSLEAKMKEREEKLRKLKMVKMYRTKNNLQELSTLTATWREVAQEAAESLLASSTHQPRPSMAQMLDYLHIDHQLIQYSSQDDSFY